MTGVQDPRIGQPVQRNVQVDGAWYGPGDVPTAEHAIRITNWRVWGDEMVEYPVPGVGQFQTDEDGKTVPPSGQPVVERPAEPVPSTEETETEPKPDPKRRGKA